MKPRGMAITRPSAAPAVAVCRGETHPVVKRLMPVRTMAWVIKCFFIVIFFRFLAKWSDVSLVRFVAGHPKWLSHSHNS